MTPLQLLLALLLLPIHPGFGQPEPIRLLVNHVVVTDTVVPAVVIGSKSLTIQLIHAASDTVPYQCRLDGADERWLTYRQRIFLSYADLAGGTYRLLVRPVGQPVRQSVRLTIDPQLWQRWWFLPSVYFFVFLILASGLYFSYLHKIHQQIRLQQVRDRIARDLHDDMGSYLSSISILSAMLPTDPNRARQNLDRIGQTARLVMDAMSDIVWSINPTQDTMQQVLDRMKQVADELFGGTDTAVSFRVEAGVDTLSLPLENRRDFFLIYKETMTNAARYARSSQIQVGLGLANGLLRLTVDDNGQGFDPAHASHRPGGGNGLHNLRVRAEALSGTLVIESVPGQGTRVVLALPV